MTNANGQALGTATLTDTLPEGWEFAEIVAGSNYLIFEGTGKADGTVQATNTTPDTVTGLSADFTGRTATFTFGTLNKAYVILVKAKPTSETAAKYFNANKTTPERNTLSLKAKNWPTGVTSTQDVTINSRLLEKTLATPTAGELLWTVDYRPYNLPQPGARLEDTLPAGIDLRTDSSGALLLDGNISAHEMTLHTDGSYTLGGEITLKAGENIFYDTETRVLSFNILDNAKAYRFSYLTDVTGEPGEVSNKVSLYGDTTQQVETEQPYLITKADGEASLKKNGWISITKTDGANAPLAGAEFTIFALDGKTVIRAGVTDSDGVIKLKVIPDGNYILRETAAPGGYTSESVPHSLSVTTKGNDVIASIDGKTGANANTIAVQNFPEDTAGNLTISKTVAGNAADSTKAFEFTLTLNGADGTYSYVGNGVPNGTIQSGDRVSLAHSQSITITGLPKEATYTVAEADYTSDGYSMVSTGETGTIVADDTQTAAFTNTRNETPIDEKTGNLTINKTVAGLLGDQEQAFTFVVDLGASGSYRYSGSKTGEIKNGQTITLKHGESIVIEALPVGTAYQVTEKEANQNGYSTSATGASGTITEFGQTAAFVNSMKGIVPKTGDDGLNAIWAIGLIGSAVLLLVLVVLNSKFKNKRSTNNR